MNSLQLQDSIASKTTLERDKYVCRLFLPKCSRTAREVHHIFGRQLRKTRFDIRFLISVCRNCHLILEADAQRALKIISEKIGEKKFSEMIAVVKSKYGIDYSSYIKDYENRKKRN